MVDLLLESRERVSLTIPNSPYAGPARSPSSRSPAAAAAAAAARSPHLSPADAFALPPASELGGGGASSSAGGGGRRRASSGDATFDACRPMIIFVALVDRLQGVLKGDRPWHAAPPAAAAPSAAAVAAAAAGGSGAAAAPDEAWVAALKERLHRHDLAVLKELDGLLKTYEGWLELGDFDAWWAELGFRPERPLAELVGLGLRRVSL